MAIQIRRDDLAIRARVKLTVAPKPLRRPADDGLASASERAIDAIVDVILDEVFAGNAVLVAPSPVVSYRNAAGQLLGSPCHRAGRWGEDEPFPFA